MRVFLYINAWLMRFKQRLSGQPQSEHCAALAEPPADLPHIGDNTMTSTPTTPAPTTANSAEELAKQTAASPAQQPAETTGGQTSMNDQATDTAEQALGNKNDCSAPAIASAESSTAAPAHSEATSPPPPVAKKADAQTVVKPEPIAKAKVKPQAKSSPEAKAEPAVKPQAKHEPVTEPALKTEPEPEPAPEEATQAPVLNVCEPDQHWQACYEAVTGLAHRDANPPLPCQDSAIALNSQRPIVIVADGAGSSAVSELGAQAVTTGLARLLNTLERHVAQLLDQPQSGSNDEIRSFALLLVKHAKGILDDLAVQHRRPQKDFRCTLLLAIQGKAQLLWLKIGDGALVTERLQQQDTDKLIPTLTTLGSVGKGEFANATTFIDDHLQPTDVQIGSCSSAHITGFAAMSDGAADRLVANDGSQVSSQISDWLNKLRQGTLKRRELTRLFSSENFTRGTTGDDASVALCASGLKTDAADEVA